MILLITNKTLITSLSRSLKFNYVITYGMKKNTGIIIQEGTKAIENKTPSSSQNPMPSTNTTISTTSLAKTERSVPIPERPKSPDKSDTLKKHEEGQKAFNNLDLANTIKHTPESIEVANNVVVISQSQNVNNPIPVSNDSLEVQQPNPEFVQKYVIDNDGLIIEVDPIPIVTLAEIYDIDTDGSECLRKENNFTTFVKEGILEYGSKGETKLTPEAYDIYRSIQQKSILHISKENLNITDKESIPTESDLEFDLIDTNQQEITFIAGTLTVAEEVTEILKPIQSHLIVGISDADKGYITAVVLLTSEKGTKSGISGMSSTTKLSDTQPISGDNKGQYARPLYPPMIIKTEDFTEHKKGTEYVNQPDVKLKLEGLKKIAERYDAIKYDTRGITMNDLEEIRELKEVINTKEKEITSNQTHEEVD